MRGSLMLLALLLALVFAHGPVHASVARGGKDSASTPVATGTSLHHRLGIHFDSVDDALRYNPLLSTLRKGLDTTELKAQLGDPELVATILAPTNSAFTKLLKKLELSEEELFQQKDLLTQVLQYHVIPGAALKVDDINDGQYTETLLPNHHVKFHKEKYWLFLNKVTVESDDPDAEPAEVSLADVEAAKTVIHVINRVLLPNIQPSPEAKVSEA